VNGDERERLRPPSSATPARKPDAAPVRAPIRDVPERSEAGAGQDFSALPIHPVDAKSWSKTLNRFGHNSTSLAADHRKAIEALATEIAARVALAPGAKAKIMLSGHTDTSGDETYNAGLGKSRADTVKAALEAALARNHVGSERIASIDSESFGELSPAKPTADNVREPLNRRVEITVTIEAPLPAASTQTEPSEKPERKKPIDINLPPDYPFPEEDWWTRTERERKKIEEYDRTHPRKTSSLTDVLVEGVTKALEPIIGKLPKSLRSKAREGIRKGIEAGTEKGCEAAIDASGVTGEQANAMKAACKAALKTKPGAK
jgi:outer membrane protein OmpA-like peptidoglycan-associated protein